jgi:predicted nucleic acid-binding protein
MNQYKMHRKQVVEEMGAKSETRILLSRFRISPAPFCNHTLDTGLIVRHRDGKESESVIST